MIWREIVFGVVAAVMVVSCIRLVTTKNLVHGALWLVMALGGTAVLYVLFLAEFVAWVQVLVYVGAIVVLLLFGIITLTRGAGTRQALDNQQRGIALVCAAGLFGVLSFILVRAFAEVEMDFSHVFKTATLGEVLFRTWVLPFEAVSVLLTAALVGAIALARKN